MRQIQRLSSYAVIVDSDRILLCRVVPTISPQREWTLPGGGLEFGEHPETGAVREVLEETGLHVRLDGPAAVDSELFDGAENRRYHAVRIIYRASVIGGELTHERNGSTDQCAWFRRDEAEALPLVPLARLGLQLAFAI